MSEEVERTQQEFITEAAPTLSAAELRKQKQVDKNKKKSLEKRQANRPYTPKSDIEPKPDEQQEILQARDIRHPRVLEVLPKLARLAARQTKLQFNWHLLNHGLQNTLRVVEREDLLPAPEDIWYPGERIRLHELHAIWDYSTSWRVQPDEVIERVGLEYFDQGRMTFDGFRQLRRMSIVDTLKFGNRILGKDFHPEPHGRWANELFVKKNPNLLRENYDWEDIKAALAGQSDIHERLLISSRSSYKSSYNIVDLLQWVLCFGGDIRIMCVSATRPLSKGFLKSFRDYFTLKVNEPSLFNQLFPEYMLFPDELGKTTDFTSPMRRLDLIQATYTPVSLDTEGLAGERNDLLVAEDIAEISNSSTPDQRESTLYKWDMLRELTEPFGYVQLVGTPISSGTGQGDDPGDIYSVLIAREKERDTARMLYMICPCWEVKEGVRKEPYDKTLTEDEVDLLFPSRLTFKVLKSKLLDNEKVFRQQSLCAWVPDQEEGPKVHFSLDALHHALMPADGVPRDGQGGAFTVITCDLALTANRTSDFSALACTRIWPCHQRWGMTVVDVEYGRWTMKELALKLVLFRKKHPETRSMYIEKISGTEMLQDHVNELSRRNEISMQNVMWTVPDSGRDAKQNRLLSLSILLEDSDRLLRFVNATSWNDEVFKQFCRVSTFRPNRQGDIRYRGIDCADAISMAQRFIPRLQVADVVATPEQERIAQIEKMRAAHSAMFESGSNWNVTTAGQFGRQPQTQQPEPTKPIDPRDRLFGGNGLSATRRSAFGTNTRKRGG